MYGIYYGTVIWINPVWNLAQRLSSSGGNMPEYQRCTHLIAVIDDNDKASTWWSVKVQDGGQ